MNPFHDQNFFVLFCIETSCSSLSGAKRGRGCGGGKGRGFVKYNMSCLDVCDKKENFKKND